MKDADILIIGAGPVGVFSAYQAGFLGMKTIVVDALSEIGGQPVALYPYKYIYDIPGFSKILAKDLVANLIEQASCFNPEYILNTTVMDLKKKPEGGFLINLSNNETINCKAIVIAAGAGAFGPNKLPMDNIEQYEDKSLHYFVKQPEIFKDKIIAIAGGGDSAVDWAIELSSIAKKIYMIHRRAQFRAADSSLKTMTELQQKGQIEFIIPFMLDSIDGKDGTISSITVKDLENNRKTMETDHVLAFFGLARSLGMLEEWGLAINKLHSSIEVSVPTCETSIQGVFAVGDVAQYEHKLKLISVGFSESCVAIHTAWKYVFPDRKFHFVHSTAK